MSYTWKCTRVKAHHSESRNKSTPEDPLQAEALHQRWRTGGAKASAAATRTHQSLRSPSPDTGLTCALPQRRCSWLCLLCVPLWNLSPPPQGGSLPRAPPEQPYSSTTNMLLNRASQLLDSRNAALSQSSPKSPNGAAGQDRGTRQAHSPGTARGAETDVG